MNMPVAPPEGVPAQVPMLHDCVVERKKTAARARVMPVPPEEFGISRYARDVQNATYLFHRPYVTQDDLLEQGYDEEQVKAIPTLTDTWQTEQRDRDTVDEHQYSSDDGANMGARHVDIIEHYCRCDYEGTGEAKHPKITTGVLGGEILSKQAQDGDGKKPFREYFTALKMMHFAAVTPVII